MHALITKRITTKSLYVSLIDDDSESDDDGNTTLIIVFTIIIVLLIIALVIAVVIIVWLCVERYHILQHSSSGKIYKHK